MNPTERSSYDEGCDQAEAQQGVKCCAMGRVSAVQVIRQRIRRLRHDAEALECLLDALPRVLSPEADEALWHLAVGRELS